MEETYLVHHGILGMKWGVRRYQNPDGSLTNAGKKRYDTNNSKSIVSTQKDKYSDIEWIRRHGGMIDGEATIPRTKTPQEKWEEDIDRMRKESANAVKSYAKGKIDNAVRTRKEQKQAEKDLKKEYKIKRNDILNRHVELDEEFDKTSEGKALKNEYQKAIRKMENSNSWTDSDDAKFNRVEEIYLKKQASYAAKKLVAEYGESLSSMYANNGRVNSGKSAVDAITETWERHTY